MGAVSTSTVVQFGFDLDARFAKLPIFLKPRQVAELLGNCTTQHIRMLRERGAIEACDIRSPGAQTGTYRFYKESVRLYLAKLPNTADLVL